MILCGGNSAIDLVEIFGKLDNILDKSERSFGMFLLTNTAINEIKENTFKGITFEYIIIYNCDKLTKIHVNAFFGNELITKQLRIIDNYRLSNQDNSIFEMLTKFVNLEQLYLTGNNIIEIPDKAFQLTNGYQNKLKTLVIGGTSIKRIGNNILTSLNLLDYFKLDNTSINTIPEFAFAFDQESNENLELRITNNVLLNDNALHESALVYFKRPVTLDLEYQMNLFENIDNVLVNFLRNNEENKIIIDEPIDCNNCKFAWLKLNQDLFKQILTLKCENGKDINFQVHFQKCTP